MKQRRVVLVISPLGLISMVLLGGRMLIPVAAQSRSAQVPGSVAAVAGQKGGQDIFGAYEPVANWPQDLSELPNIPMPAARRTPEFGPSLAYPLGQGRVPMRNATTASPPANGGTGQLAEDGLLGVEIGAAFAWEKSSWSS